MKARELLLGWIKSRLSVEAVAWIEDKAALFASGAATDAQIFSVFSAAIRHSGKSPLNLDSVELKTAGKSVPGWDPRDWTCGEAARVYLLTSLPPVPKSAQLMDQMFQTADLGESLALEKALPLLPLPETHLSRAREGVRSNNKLIFEAVALRNPYPSLHFDEAAWNQLVVKTQFVDSPVEEVAGLERRANPALARILTDLMDERRAAGRTISPQVWRCIGPFADAKALQTLEKIYAGGEPIEKRSAALALLSCPAPQKTVALAILNTNPTLAGTVRSGTLTWENLRDGE